MSPSFREALQEALAGASGRPELTVDPEQRIDELGLDSLALNDLMVVLEDRFEITLEPGDMAGLITLSDLERLVEAKRGGAS